MKKFYLLTPGPTPVPEGVREVMANPIIHHRTREFQEILSEVIEGLKYIFQTKNDVLLFSSSGTGAMEAIVANLLSSGDKALVVRGGKFGERWGELTQAYGIETIFIDVNWGDAVEPGEIQNILKANSDIKAVFITHCETSTGVVSDVEAIAKVVSSTKALLAVDAISSLASIPLKTDEWMVDVVAAGSQKGLMVPPGLSFVSVSSKAWEMAEKSTLPKYYFSFKQARKAQEKANTPWTPAITLVLALRETLKMLRNEGLEQVFLRHRRLAEATRQAALAMGLELLAPKSPAISVTAIKLPEGIDGAALVKNLRKKHGIWVAGGQAQLKGKIIRIAHMGYIKQFELLEAISAIEKELSELGYQLESGIGRKAAEDVLK